MFRFVDTFITPKSFLPFLILILLSCKKEDVAAQTSAQSQSGQPVLAGTDGLGRTLLQSGAVGKPRSNKQVALFYFFWQGDDASKTSGQYWDLNDIWHQHPEAFQDFDNPYWGSGAARPGSYYYWGQPIYGYYKGDDEWVHLKNIQLLTDAGVDLLVIDATNAIIYPSQSEALMRAMETVKKQGRQPPKLAYYTNTRSGETMQHIYETYYKTGAPSRHPDCWYYLDNKPLIIGLSAEAAGKDYASFFTIRESQWPNETQKVNGWPWIEFQRPQRVYHNSKGQPEIVNVSVAQHPNLAAAMGGSAFYGQHGNWGRSYHNGQEGNPETDLPYGYNVQEQWDYAIQQGTPFIFVTGWNEWVAGRWASNDGNPEHSLFVDQASPEYSRDIEPTLTAGLKDHYYMQMVNNIRRYKGISENARLSAVKTIRSFPDWDDVYPEYTDYSGDTKARNHPGAQSDPSVMYTNASGRNDFTILKVARDVDNLYFLAQTSQNLSSDSGADWMRLYLNTDRQITGWNGYDYRIIGGDTLQKYNGTEWITQATVQYSTNKNQLMITVPRKLISQSNAINFEFKWADHMQAEDPMDWYQNGDAAPGGRFAFIAQE